MKKGFTLVELMIVVSILGILAVIVLPEFQGHAAESKESAAKSSLHAVRAQIELYKLHHNGLAPGYMMGTMKPAASGSISLESQFVGTTKLDGTPTASRVPSDPYLYGPYMSELPVNPFNDMTTIRYATDGATEFTPDDTSGWIYERTTGTFKLNKTGTDASGTAYIDF